jgi:hypothetical protein
MQCLAANNRGLAPHLDYFAKKPSKCIIAPAQIESAVYKMHRDPDLPGFAFHPP